MISKINKKPKKLANVTKTIQIKGNATQNPFLFIAIKESQLMCYD